MHYKISDVTGHALVTGLKSIVTVQLDTRYTVVVMVKHLIK